MRFKPNYCIRIRLEAPIGPCLPPRVVGEKRLELRCISECSKRVLKCKDVGWVISGFRHHEHSDPIGLVFVFAEVLSIGV